MSVAIDRVGAAISDARLTSSAADPVRLANDLVAEARDAAGVDLARVHAGIAAIAGRDPSLAQATRAAVPDLLGPVDAGRFLSGFFDDLGDVLGGIVDKVKDLVREATRVGVDGTVATTGPDLSVPATPGAAPKSITFSRALQAQFNAQWGASFPGGRAREQGGTLVFDRASGRIDLINIGGHGRTPGSFTPDLSVPDPSKTRLLGIFHTHPHDAGQTGISFSGADVAVMIQEHHNIIMAQSGDRQFVMMRTAETPANVDYRGMNILQNMRIAELVSGGKSFAAASSQAASELATTYHLAYYEGSNGHLSRVNP